MSVPPRESVRGISGRSWCLLSTGIGPYAKLAKTPCVSKESSRIPHPGFPVAGCRPGTHIRGRRNRVGGILCHADAGMSPNPVKSCQNGRDFIGCRVHASGWQDGFRTRSVKKRARELSVWRISPPRRPFLCGKNGISLLKEISFLPQRREFLAAKKFPGVWKAGKNGASGGFFLLFGDFSRAKSVCLFASLPSRPADAGADPSARRPVAGGKVSRETGFRLSSSLSAGPRGSRISTRPRPCARPRDSRGAGFDVLTK